MTHDQWQEPEQVLATFMALFEMYCILHPTLFLDENFDKDKKSVFAILGGAFLGLCAAAFFVNWIQSTNKNLALAQVGTMSDAAFTIQLPITGAVAGLFFKSKLFPRKESEVAANDYVSFEEGVQVSTSRSAPTAQP